MGHARDPNQFLEVFGNELRPVVGDDPGLRLRVKFLGALQDNLKLCGLANSTRKPHEDLLWREAETEYLGPRAAKSHRALVEHLRCVTRSFGGSRAYR